MNGHGSIARRVLGTLAIAAAVAGLVSGCSEAGFPAVHDMPAPRAETPLTPDQVKEATDALISERDRLSTEAQGNGQPNPATNDVGNAAPASQQNASSAPPAASPAAASGAQSAGAYAKP